MHLPMAVFEAPDPYMIIDAPDAPGGIAARYVAPLKVFNRQTFNGRLFAQCTHDSGPKFRLINSLRSHSQAGEIITVRPPSMCGLELSLRAYQARLPWSRHPGDAALWDSLGVALGCSLNPIAPSINEWRPSPSARTKDHGGQRPPPIYLALCCVAALGEKLLSFSEMSRQARQGFQKGLADVGNSDRISEDLLCGLSSTSKDRKVDELSSSLSIVKPSKQFAQLTMLRKERASEKQPRSSAGHEKSKSRDDDDECAAAAAATAVEGNEKGPQRETSVRAQHADADADADERDAFVVMAAGPRVWQLAVSPFAGRRCGGRTIPGLQGWQTVRDRQKGPPEVGTRGCVEARREAQRASLLSASPGRVVDVARRLHVAGRSMQAPQHPELQQKANLCATSDAVSNLAVGDVGECWGRAFGTGGAWPRTAEETWYFVGLKEATRLGSCDDWVVCKSGDPRMKMLEQYLAAPCEITTSAAASDSHVAVAVVVVSVCINVCGLSALLGADLQRISAAVQSHICMAQQATHTTYHTDSTGAAAAATASTARQTARRTKAAGSPSSMPHRTAPLRSANSSPSTAGSGGAAQRPGRSGWPPCSPRSANDPWSSAFSPPKLSLAHVERAEDGLVQLRGRAREASGNVAECDADDGGLSQPHFARPPPSTVSDRPRPLDAMPRLGIIPQQAMEPVPMSNDARHGKTADGSRQKLEGARMSPIATLLRARLSIPSPRNQQQRNLDLQWPLDVRLAVRRSRRNALLPSPTHGILLLRGTTHRHRASLLATEKHAGHTTTMPSGLALGGLAPESWKEWPSVKISAEHSLGVSTQVSGPENCLRVRQGSAGPSFGFVPDTGRVVYGRRTGKACGTRDAVPTG
ncbi:hypothetical protein G7046_g9434 [Stylonectria norvegica]|nr:hypothetical protein G7046_g9434 [Stylonectria norvegica]